MPSEPAESNFKNKVRVDAYPTHESGGIVWTYMGPPETMTPFRDFGSDALPREQWRASKHALRLQLGAGDGGQHRHVPHLLPAPNLADRLTSRTTAPTSPATRPTRCRPSSAAHDRAPRLEVQEPGTATATPASATTPAGYTHMRMTEFILPFTTRVAQIPLSNNFGLGSMVPIDDYNCWRGRAIVPGGPRAEQAGLSDNECQRVGPPRTQNAANDFLIDREKQRTFSYTGIVGINQQDMAVTESMGAIYQRHQEHLGTTIARLSSCGAC